MNESIGFRGQWACPPREWERQHQVAEGEIRDLSAPTAAVFAARMGERGLRSARAMGWCV